MMQKWVPTVFLSLFAAAAVHAQQQKLQFRSPNDAVRYYEDLMGQVVQQVRTMQDENARLSGQILDLQNRINTLEQKVQNSTAELNTVRKQMAADKAARSRDFEQLADKVQRAASAPGTAPAAKSAAPGGEYDIYEVKPGATLYVISRATGVPVQAIKSANNLKSDVIRPGDKLKIPVVR